MPAAAIIGAATVGSSLIGSRAAGKAADAQASAANDATALQREIYDQTTSNFAPYLGAGNLALQAYMSEMGLGAAPTIGGQAAKIQTITTPGKAATGGKTFQDDGVRGLISPGGTGGTAASTSYRVNGRDFSTLADAQAYASANPTGGTRYSGYQETPGYQFQMDQGLGAVNALAGARGGLNSGRTMKELQTYGQGLANSTYDSYLNRLSGLTNMGTSAAGNQASAGANYASNAGNAMMQAGNATANGYINSANAITGGISNALGSWQYMQALGQ